MKQNAFDVRYVILISIFIFILANGIMPIAVTLRHGHWLAAVGGVVAMGLPLFLAIQVPRGPSGSRTRFW